MPILVMAMLALIAFGTIGILLVVAVMMEHSGPADPPRRKVSHATSDVTPIFDPSFDRPRGEDTPTQNPSSKEKVHEHACTG